MNATPKEPRPNRGLRIARERRGWSQRRVAEEIGTNVDTVSKWERGINVPDPYFREKLCNLFDMDAVELGFVESAPSSQAALATESDSDVNRREAGKQIVSFVESAFLAHQFLLNPPLWERLSKALERSSRIDEAGLKGLEQNIRDYWDLRRSIGYRNLLHGFSGHLETVIQLLQSSQSPASRIQLCAIASETAQHIGAIYFDMNDYVKAREYYRVAIDTAKEAEDPHLWAVGLVRMSSLPIYSKEPQGALPFLQAARQLAETNGTSTTRTWIASMEAEAYANIQEASSCLQTLKQTEQMIEKAGSEEGPYGVKFDYARFLGYKGVCLLRLQQPEAALTALKESMRLSESLSSRQSAIVMTDLASAYTQQGEIEEACRLATQALIKADHNKSLLVIQRLLDVRRDMNPWQTSPTVREFDKQLVLRGVFSS